MPVSTIVTGMVLSTMPVGDYDKRLVILTKELGKISAFAKGARRQNSALLACSQPFAFGEFSVYPGKSSYTVLSAEISNYFGELRNDIESVYYGLYFCEFTDYVTKENNDEIDKLKLLYQTLRTISKKIIPLPLVRIIFEFKIMALDGEAPSVFLCTKCEKEISGEGSQPGKAYFSAKSGGVLCGLCHLGEAGAIPLSTSALYALQYIISKEIEKLYTFNVKEEVLDELKRCAKSYLNHYLDHEFKSAELLKIL